MKFLVTSITLVGYLLSGCASIGASGAAQSPSASLQPRAIPSQCSSLQANESLEGYYCRFLSARNAYHQASQNYQYSIEAQNILIFGAAVYAGSTLALNSGGLRESQTDDLTETALGLGVVQAAASMLGVQRRNELYRYAGDAAYCYSAHIRMLIVRKQNFELLQPEGSQDRFPEFTLAERIRGVEAALSDPAQHGDADLNDARDLVREAYARLASLEEQRRLLNVAQSELNDLAYTFVRTVEERARNKPLDYTQLIAAIQQAAAAGVPADTGGDPKPFTPERSATLPDALAALRLELDRADRLQPDIASIRTSMRTCPTVLQDGQPISFTPRDLPAGVFSLPAESQERQQANPA
jgi:hypothetical protein